jgi:TolB-like protein
MSSLRILCSAMLIALLMTSSLSAQKKDKGKSEDKAEHKVYPVAIFPFAERGRDAAELGNKVTDLLFANLVTNPDMYLVEREDIDKLFAEQELNRSGLINPAQATQIGYLTGAKILVTGSVLVVGEKMYLVAKIIGTETSRVLGASAKGKVDDDLDGLVEELAQNVAATITERAKDLVAKPVSRKDRLAALVKSMGKGKRPSVWIDIPERHIGQTTYDPAAETELMLFCRELGFEVIDRKAGNQKDADVVLTGEGFSQFASRHGNLVSVKARLEVKALDRKSGKVIAVDRHTSVSVDLAEHIAAKSALQDAAVSIAERLLPKLAGDGKGKRDKK